MNTCEVRTNISWKELISGIEKVTWKAAIKNEFNPKDFCKEDIKRIQNVGAFLETYFKEK